MSSLTKAIAITSGSGHLLAMKKMARFGLVLWLCIG